MPVKHNSSKLLHINKTTLPSSLELANKNLQCGSVLSEFTQPKEPYFPQNFRMRTLDWLLGNVTE